MPGAELLAATGGAFSGVTVGAAAGGICCLLVVAGAPQLLQNALPVVIALPQFTQNLGGRFAGWLCGAPQELQNRTPSGTGAPQRLQIVFMLC